MYASCATLTILHLYVQHWSSPQTTSQNLEPKCKVGCNCAKQPNIVQLLWLVLQSFQVCLRLALAQQVCKQAVTRGSKLLCYRLCACAVSFSASKPCSRTLPLVHQIQHLDHNMPAVLCKHVACCCCAGALPQLTDRSVKPHYLLLLLCRQSG